MQTQYNINPDIAQAGALVDLPNEVNDIISRLSEESGNFAFGRLAVLGTDKDNQALLPALSTDITNALKVLGVTALDINKEQSNAKVTAGLDQGYDEKEIMALLKRGRIWIKAEDAVTPESDVFVRFDSQAQVTTLTFAAPDLVSGNLIDLDINGVAITQVPFNSTHAQTMTDLATEIQSNANVATATVTAAREITITTIDGDTSVVLTNIIVTGAGTQPVGTFAIVTTAKPSSDIGKFRSDADTGTTAAQLAKARFMSSAVAGGYAQLSINLD